MRKSKYNIWIDIEKDTFLCYNSITGGFVELDKETKLFLDSIDSVDLNTEKMSPEDQVKLNQLLAARIIVEDDYDYVNQSKLHFLKSTYKSNSLALTILPTLSCNCKCTYCYQQAHKQGTMSDGIIDSLKTFATDYFRSNGIKLLAVNWYGGEPLLEPRIIEDLSVFFIALSKKNNANYFAEIISNSLLLTDEIAFKLRELKVRKIQITLDGSRNSHNQKRKGINNEDTFDSILEKIILASKHMEVAVRVNIDNNFKSEIDTFFSDIQSLRGVKNIGLYPGKLTSDVTTACASIESSCLSNKDFAQIFNLFYVKAIENGFPLTWYSRARSGGCIATNPDGFTIQPNGDLCKCWSQVGEKGESFGNILSGRSIINPDNYYKWVLYDPFHDKECLKCKYFPICKGGCPAKNVTATTDYMSPNTKVEKCTISKYNLKEMLLLTYKNKKEQMAQKVL